MCNMPVNVQGQVLWRVYLQQFAAAKGNRWFLSRYCIIVNTWAHLAALALISHLMEPLWNLYCIVYYIPNLM